MNPRRNMKSPAFSLLALVVLCSSVTSRGGESDAKGSDAKITTPKESPWTVSSELTLDYGYVGPSKTGGSDISEQSSGAEYVMTLRYKEGAPLRIGFEWNRYSFSNTVDSPIPNTLQSEAIIAGVDFEVFNSVFIRIEAQPGWYNAAGRVTGDAFNVPVIIGGSYLYSKDLQIALGVSIDPQREYPVIPGGGIRWQINDKWVLNAMLPKPRLEYQATSALTIYGGADVLEGSYRAPGDFGRFTHNPNLNGRWLDYDEVRLGGGASFKFSDKVHMDFEMGYMAYREFNFHGTDVNPHSGSAGLYGGVTIGAKF